MSIFSLYTAGSFHKGSLHKGSVHKLTNNSSGMIPLTEAGLNGNGVNGRLVCMYVVVLHLSSLDVGFCTLSGF